MGCGVGRSRSKVYNAICYLQNEAKQVSFAVVGFVAQDQ